MVDILVNLLLPIVMLWLGSMEYRMRKLEDKVNQVPDRKEVSILINDKQEAIKVLQAELKEDIRRVEDKLDRLLARANHQD